jgi:glycine cleavage system H lipoate-binding protein
VVESVKAASGVYAPADLEVVEVNEALDAEPELVNTSCYDKGWLVKFKSAFPQICHYFLMVTNHTFAFQY